MWALLSPLLRILGGIFTNISGAEIAKYTAEGEVGVAQAQAMGGVEQKWWFVAVLLPAFALPYVIYTWKAVAFDKVIGPMFDIHTRTDVIGGPLGWVFTVVVIGLFMQAMIK